MKYLKGKKERKKERKKARKKERKLQQNWQPRERRINTFQDFLRLIKEQTDHKLFLH